MRWWLVGILAAVLVVTACTMDIPDQSGDKTTDAISISGSKFNPGTARNVTGTVITFTNNDGINHNIHWDSQPSGSSLTSTSDFSSGTKTFTPLVAGTYEYHCTIHGSGMSGTLIITD